MNRIKEQLQLKNLRQQDLANLLGVNRSTVSLWCSNSVQPPLPKLYYIADYLQVEIAELLKSSKELKK
jgi:putative transcriptional regulator